jgi:cyclopropane fatty-acyl-phospholipid synthase-like methyltransferase
MNRRSNPGAKQPHIFSHEKAEWLDEPEREAWLPTSALVELLELRPGLRILDFGAGTGRYAQPFAERHRDAVVHAYDVQAEFRDIVERRARTAHLPNLVPVDRIDGSYDRIFAANVLHEIGDIDVAEIRDALAPNGFALVIDWNASIDRPTGPPREHAHTPQEALARLAAAGFTKIKKIEEPRLPYHFVLRALR